MRGGRPHPRADAEALAQASEGRPNCMMMQHKKEIAEAKASATEGGETGIRTLVPISIGKRFSRPSRSTTPASLHGDCNRPIRGAS